MQITLLHIYAQIACVEKTKRICRTFIHNIFELSIIRISLTLARFGYEGKQHKIDWPGISLVYNLVTFTVHHHYRLNAEPVHYLAKVPIQSTQFHTNTDVLTRWKEGGKEKLGTIVIRPLPRKTAYTKSTILLQALGIWNNLHLVHKTKLTFHSGYKNEI